MRYSESEITTLVGIFKPSQVVKIKIIEVSNDQLVTLVSDTCIESQHMPGVYMWKTTNINQTLLAGNGYTNMVYQMTCDQGKVFHGKFVFGGYVDDKVLLTDSIAKLDKIIEKLQIIIGLT